MSLSSENSKNYRREQSLLVSPYWMIQSGDSANPCVEPVVDALELIDTKRY